jgi:hypothetical protein
MESAVRRNLGTSTTMSNSSENFTNLYNARARGYVTLSEEVKKI